MLAHFHDEIGEEGVGGENGIKYLLAKHIIIV